MITRRKFIRNSSVLAVTPLVLGGIGSCKEEKTTMQKAVENGVKIEDFGIQLWTVRDFMADDVNGTLQALSEQGYTQIESFQGEKGVFWGSSPKEFNDYLSSIGLRCSSTHCDGAYALDLTKEDEFKKLADDAVSIGIEYLVNPFMGQLKTIDEFKQATDGFNRLGEICQKAGLRYAYHNHHYSFIPVDGVYPQDVMMQGADPNLVDFEMDIYWVVTAKQDPVAWLEKYPNRWRLCHIKDRYPEIKVEQLIKEENHEGDWPVPASCVLGEGQIDFDNILKVAADQGMKQWHVEQERYDNITSLEAAGKDATYMKKFA